VKHQSVKELESYLKEVEFRLKQLNTVKSDIEAKIQQLKKSA